jgi:hypothetical protein
MKILNTYYGLEAYDFAAEPHHACVRYDVSEEEILFQVAKAKQSLENKKCFWYLVNVVEVNPHTGESTSVNFHSTVGEKIKIVLNAKGAGKTKAPGETTIKPMEIGDLLDHLGMLGKVNPLIIPPVVEEELEV